MLGIGDNAADNGCYFGKWIIPWMLDSWVMDNAWYNAPVFG